MTQARHYDLLIHGGIVIDGNRTPRYQADIGITDGRIVAPGFIDSHTHDDQALLAQPDMAFKASQGVTTVIAGNCGISAAPIRPGMRLPAPLNLMDGGPQRRFASFAAYLDTLRALSHMRDEADHAMDALEETFHIGREPGVPVVVSHHKLQQSRPRPENSPTPAVVFVSVSA